MALPSNLHSLYLRTRFPPFPALTLPDFIFSFARSRLTFFPFSILDSNMRHTSSAAPQVQAYLPPLRDSTFRRLRSTIILFAALAVAAVVLFLAWKVVSSVREGISNAFEKKNINVSRTSASVGVKPRTQQSVVDSAQRYAYKAWENSAVPPDAKVSRMLKLREWKDRKRHVYSGSGTEAANQGW